MTTPLNDTNRPKRNLSAPPDPRARNGREINIADAAAEPPEDRVFRMPEAAIPDPPAEKPAAAPKPLPTFTIAAVLDDFPITVQFSGRADQLAATIGHLRALGAVPPTPAARAAVAAEKERAAPICEFHGPMKESTKAPGTWYCPAKMGNGDYCKSKG